MRSTLTAVIPANAGTHCRAVDAAWVRAQWVPAFAGTTGTGGRHD